MRTIDIILAIRNAQLLIDQGMFRSAYIHLDLLAKDLDKETADKTQSAPTMSSER